jgi:23S rRNA (pseudouridine1915-N3)-methyltransferase
MHDSPGVAALLERHFNAGQSIIVIIGGAYGVDERVHSRANATLSLSKLVFPHQLVRLMCIEQLYRAQEISRGGRYHHV